MVGHMAITPNEHDAAAGFTEVLTAVAIRRFPDVPAGEPPWTDSASAGISWPAEVDRWLNGLPDWYEHDVNYMVCLVPEEDYRPLYQLRIPGLEELSTFDFLATKEEVANVRAAIARDTGSS